LPRIQAIQPVLAKYADLNKRAAEAVQASLQPKP